MTLLFLLLIPIVIGVVAFVATSNKDTRPKTRFVNERFAGWNKIRRITWKELLLLEVPILILVSAGYYLALQGQMRDTEIWNGHIDGKAKVSVSCCHSYDCNCTESCSGSGTSRSCTKTCQTCYEHSNDVEWEAWTSNKETVFRDSCNPPYTFEPSRFTAIKVGEPTAVEHSYKNYIKGNPDTLFKHVASTGYTIPQYPKTYDLYRVRSLVTVGVQMPDQEDVNNKLRAINDSLGSPKQVNIVLVVTANTDIAYSEALRSAWLGGKKNDVIVLIQGYPKLEHVTVISWTKNEDFKVKLRDGIQAFDVWDTDKIMNVVKSEIFSGFKRRPMADFEYLASTIEPPMWAIMLIVFLSMLCTGLGCFFMWKNDVV